MTTPIEVLRGTLYDLLKEEFKEFKWFLCQEGVLEGFKPIQAGQLEDADRSTTVDVMLHIYRTDVLKVARVVFKKINRNDLVQKISGSIEEPADPERDTEQRVQPESWLLSVWTQLMNRLSEPSVNQLVEILFQQKVFSPQEKNVIKAQIGNEKALKLIEFVQQKGPDAISRLKAALPEADPSLCKTLNLL